MTFPVLPANGPSGYNLTNSLRFRASASAYLNRTPASNGNSQIFTWSAWIKRGTLGNQYQNMIGAGSVPGGGGDLVWLQMDTFAFYANGGLDAALITTQVFRDPSAWYHFVVSVDTTQATAANRVRIYVNGVQITAFSTATYPAQNYNFIHLNKSTVVQYLGLGYLNNFDGYMAEVNFIDGQALTPSSFGSTNAVTGVWQPAKYAGTYGTNGFYLPFTNTTSTTTLGNDFSGNGNNWTTNNISLTSGVTYDAMTDVPTLTSPTAANYCVLNPLNTQSTATLAGGNLNLTTPSTSYGMSFATVGVSSGKYYWEVTVTGITAGLGIGINKATVALTQYMGQSADSYCYINSGEKYNNNTTTAYGATYTTNDVIGVAFDSTAGTLTFYKNNTSQGTAFSSLTGEFFPAVSDQSNGSGSSLSINFGQRPFAYTPPSGFVALNTFNLPSSTIPNGANFMAADIYTGNGSSQTRTLNFQPDFIWNKIRSQAYDHNLFDVLRGVDKRLISNLTSQELTITNALTAFNSNGYSVGNYVSINGSGESIVNWAWKAGGTGVTNTAGSITSTVSANTTSGFSVATFTMPVSGVSTVGHGLGVAPSLMILKGRSNATGWAVYHASTGNTGYTVLNTTGAFTTDANAWNNTSPTSSVFTIGTTFNNLGTYVAYCFAPIAGFSAFGSYTGNGSTDGPFVYTGFRPRWVMIKRTDGANDWIVWDTSRNIFNVIDSKLSPNTSSAEFTNASAVGVDTVSNGFKLRGTDAAVNLSSGTFIYAAFAENPFKNALAR